MKISLTLLLLITLSSCFKTTEEIQREKMVDSMKKQQEQSAVLVAQLTAELQELRTRLASQTGRLEEINYKQNSTVEQTSQNFTQTTSQLAAQVSQLQKEVSANKKTLALIQIEQKKQQTYLKKLNSTLSEVTGISDSPQNKLKQAHDYFEKNNQSKAMDLYLEVVDAKEINEGQRNHIRFNLGLLHYWKKEYEQSSVWFSKIYTKWPKSSYAPGSLLYIARCFLKQGKNEEAKATFEQLISQYPKSRHVKNAKEEMPK